MFTELYAIYAEIIRAATDDQIPQHLDNLVKDAVAIGDAVKQVIDTAKARVAPPAA